MRAFARTEGGPGDGRQQAEDPFKVQAIWFDEPMAKQVKPKVSVVHVNGHRCEGPNFGTDWNDVDLANIVVPRISGCRLAQ